MDRRQSLALAGMFAACSVTGFASLAKAATKNYGYTHLDVFTETPLTGNQLAVFLDPAGLSAAQMFALTKEVAFAESTFVFPAEAPGTDFRVRIFNTGGEVPVAGHPTIGTVFALANAGKIKPGRAKITLGLGIGPTDIDLLWEANRLKTAWMHQRLPVFGGKITDTSAVATALGLSAQDFADARYPIQEVSCGSPTVIIPLRSREAVDKATMNGAAMRALLSQAKLTSGGTFIFSAEPNADGASAYSRFLVLDGREDAATGIAAGPLGSYLANYGLVAPQMAKQILIREGVKMGRSSELHVTVATAAGQITEVNVGGGAVLVGNATIAVPQ